MTLLLHYSVLLFVERFYCPVHLLVERFYYPVQTLHCWRDSNERYPVLLLAEILKIVNYTVYPVLLLVERFYYTVYPVLLLAERFYYTASSPPIG
jgi:hypothetical protein